jgi:hypothetical protein
VFFVLSYGPLSSSVNKDTYDIPVGIVNKRWTKILTPVRGDDFARKDDMAKTTIIPQKK